MSNCKNNSLYYYLSKLLKNQDLTVVEEISPDDYLMLSGLCQCLLCV